VSAFEEVAPLGRSNIYELGEWPQDRGTCGVSGMARWHVVIHELEAGLPRAAPILRRRGPRVRRWAADLRQGPAAIPTIRYRRVGPGCRRAFSRWISKNPTNSSDPSTNSGASTSPTTPNSFRSTSPESARARRGRELRRQAYSPPATRSVCCRRGPRGVITMDD
jgi:hypothetical protein